MFARRALLSALAASAIVFAAAGPGATQNYPDKPIKIIVAVAAGGPMDTDRKSTRLNSSHIQKSRMPSSA